MRDVAPAHAKNTISMRGRSEAFSYVFCTTAVPMGDELRMLTRLNEETKVFHAEADVEIEFYLLKEPITESAYRAFLMRLYGFLIPFEAALSDTPGLGGLIDVRARSSCAETLPRSFSSEAMRGASDASRSSSA